VGSFAWNGHRHLELYYGVPCSGRVLHTINLRLQADVVSYVVGHADDEAIFVDASLTSVMAPLRDLLDVRTFVVMEDGGEVDPAFASDPRYEELIGSESPAEPAIVDERDAASICFTSGTTGRPKAVVYSHRSVVLHSMGQLMVDGHAVRRGDVILPLTPMFHVNCWGLPYSAGLAPASLVFAGAEPPGSGHADSIGATYGSRRHSHLLGADGFGLRFRRLRPLLGGTDPVRRCRGRPGTHPALHRPWHLLLPRLGDDRDVTERNRNVDPGKQR
jgi:fatty-acyl-CoA synthase